MGIFETSSQKQLASQYQRFNQAQQMQIDMHNEEQKLQAALYNQAAQKTLYNQAAQKGLTNPGAIFGASGPIQKNGRFNPNESEAYQIPLSRLVAMWQAKYGDQWVDRSPPHPDGWQDFFTAAESRLDRNGLFEKVDGWMRLKENVEKLLADN
jgi:hypothetical protein